MMKKLQLLLFLLLALPIGVLAGNTWDTATLLPLNQNTSGSLSGNKSEEWWKFTITTDGSVNIGVTPGNGLRISDVRLYHYSGVNDFSNYWQRTANAYYMDPGWYSSSFTTPDLAPGTYLIRVSRGEGEAAYTIKCDFTANTFNNNPEPDSWDPNSDKKPGTLPINGKVQGHLGYGYGSGSEDNEDWWLFEVKQDGAVTIGITPGNSLRISDIRLYHFSAVNDFTNYWQRTDNTYYFEPGWYAGNMRIPNMAPGKYLIRITRGEGWGGYELTYNFEPQAFANDNEPNSTWDGGRDNNYLARGQEKQGHLGYGYAGSGEDNEDWYRITVPRDGKVILTYTPTSVNSSLRVSDIRLFHFTAVNNFTNYWQRTSNTYYIDPGWYSSTMTIPDMAPGDYLVRVTRGEGYGGYSLKYTFEQNELPNDDEPDAWNKPMKLPVGKTLSGHLGYGYANGSEDSEDWYEVTMTSAGTLKINILPGANLRVSDVRLYYYSDGKGNYWQRTQGNYYIEPGWYFGSLTTENVEAGDYLIRVTRGEGYGNYRISFNADITDVTPMDPLPDEQQDKPVVDVEGTKYTVDEANKTVTITDVTPDPIGDIHICWFPGAVGWNVQVNGDIFKDFNGKNVKIDYTDPPTPVGDIPESRVKDVTLHVPAGSKEKYKNDPQWGKFGDIKEDGQNGPSTSGTNFIVWLSNSQKHSYALSEKPKVTMSNGNFTLTTTSTTITYIFDEVEKFTLDANGTTAIKELAVKEEPSVERQSDRIIFSGCLPTSAIRIYQLGGQLVDTQWSDADGRAEVSISGLAAGLYIVKSDSVTLKIAKR